MYSRRPEKLFKAWLALLGETYPMTHDKWSWVMGRRT